MAIVFDEQYAETLKEPEAEPTEKSEEELTDLRIDSLKTRLEDAIKDENYELATRLRDEIHRRENKS